MGNKENINKVVLAYSGGLDTSVILKWLQETYDCEVVTFSADLGQGAELEEAKKKAEDLGVKEIFIEDLKNEFVKDYVFPMFRANTIYEGSYLLGTAIARPLIAKKQIEIAKEVGADAVCHGATGKGNDQIRFELAYYGLNPDIKVIAPWREWDLNSRKKLIEFAEKNQIVITKDNLGEDPFSVDANLLHTSSEGKLLEDPSKECPEDVYQRITYAATKLTPQRRIKKDTLNDLEASLVSGEEGKKKQRYITTYERRPELREAAIAIHGLNCSVCDFNFGAFYGDYAEGYIHIDHLTPVSELSEPSQVNPQTDLVPVCANCHSIIHRKKNRTLSIDELRVMIKSRYS